jgi:penicillin-binding protein 1C
LKPFLYGLALDQRLLTAASLVDDSPVALTAENGVYIPQNYDREFRGLVSVRTALGSSLNIPAVRTLLMTGTERFFESLRAFGFSSLTESADYYGLALALGSAEVSLLDLANAYRVLANGGRWSAVAPLLKADAPARRKSVLERRVLGAEAAFVVGDILSDRGARAPSFGLENALATRVWSAVKTGTSKDMRDNWAVGFTGRHTVAVWVGNFSGASMWNVSGVHGAAPLWRDIVHFLQESAPSRPPVAPASLEAVEVSFEGIDEATRREWFLAGTAMPLVKRSSRATSALATAAGGAARIEYPADGLIVAIDPDIPAEFERIPLRMRPALAGYGWRLERGGAAGCQVLPVGDNWAPNPGQWTLSLIDASGKVADSVRFSVRGAQKHPVSCRADTIPEAPADTTESM